MLTCCLCESWRGRSYQSLAVHLLNSHRNYFVRALCHENACYCGICRKLCTVKGPTVLDTLAQHLREHGGLEGHLLEVKLGLCDN